MLDEIKTTGLLFISTLYLVLIVLEAVQLNYPLELIFSIDFIFSLKYKKIDHRAIQDNEFDRVVGWLVYLSDERYDRVYSSIDYIE